jgi:hypothetical protein
MNIGAVVLVVSGLALAGAGADDRVSGRPAAGAPSPAGVLVQHAATNDAKGARKEYDAVDWRTVAAPLPALREMSTALMTNGSAEAVALRREIHTKYWLLKGERDPELGEPGERVAVPVVNVVVLDVPEVDAPVVDAPAIEAPAVALVMIDVPDVRTPGFRFTSLEMVELRPDVLAAMGVAVPVVREEALEVAVLRVRNQVFMDAIARWEGRYGRRLDFWDKRGGRIVPAPGTVLWAMRRRVIERVEAGGDYEALWAEYDEAFRKVVGRRQWLAKKRGKTQ